MFGDRLQPLPYKITGFFEHGIKLAFNNNINIIGITQEFGTYPFNQILKSLIIENYHTHYNNIESTHFSRIRVRDTFFPPDEKWKSLTLSNGVQVFLDVIAHLHTISYSHE